MFVCRAGTGPSGRHGPQPKYREDIRPGLENAPAAFADMLSGGNFGKTLVQVSEE